MPFLTTMWDEVENMEVYIIVFHETYMYISHLYQLVAIFMEEVVCPKKG